MNNTTTYKVKTTVGQLGDFATEYWTEEDHAACNKQLEEWKASGEFGKPFTIEMTFIHNLELDARSLSPCLTSSRFEIFDFGKQIKESDSCTFSEHLTPEEFQNKYGHL
jgi:hypothetical protein